MQGLELERLGGNFDPNIKKHFTMVSYLTFLCQSFLLCKI